MSSLRVIAGTYGGRALTAPRGLRTRPTSARVREALFSMLGELDGARVLDLYAGSGALGIEALSRGASRAVLVESDRAALAAIRTNVTGLALDTSVTVLPLRVERAFSELSRSGPFELVLCDPPWSDIAQAVTVLGRIASSDLLSAEARVVLEHSARDDAPSVRGLTRFDNRAWGDTAMTLFRRGT